MTQVIYYKDDDTFIGANVPEEPKDIEYQIKAGLWCYPVPYKRPRCFSFHHMVLVAEQWDWQDYPQLTEQKKRTFEMLAHGKSTREIAEALFLSPTGVQYHIDGLKQAFRVTSREDLIAFYWKKFG